MVSLVEVIASCTGFILLLYAYLIGKKEKLNLTFIKKEELEKVEYKALLAKDIAFPLAIEGTFVIIFGLLFGKFKIISIIVIAVITLCVYAMENKIGRSLSRYRKKEEKNFKKGKKSKK